MSCHDIRTEIVQLLLSGEGNERPSEMSRHLETCAECQNFFRSEVELSQLLETQLVELEPPRQVWNNIADSLWPPRREWVLSNWFHGFEWADFRYATAVLAILLSIPLVLSRVPFDLDANTQILTQLKDYEMVVPENPFYDIETPGNPFLDKMFDWDDTNPFLGSNQ